VSASDHEEGRIIFFLIVRAQVRLPSAFIDKEMKVVQTFMQVSPGANASELFLDEVRYNGSWGS
jgi:hypothetical protein